MHNWVRCLALAKCVLIAVPLFIQVVLINTSASVRMVAYAPLVLSAFIAGTLLVDDSTETPLQRLRRGIIAFLASLSFASALSAAISFTWTFLTIPTGTETAHDNVLTIAIRIVAVGVFLADAVVLILLIVIARAPTSSDTKRNKNSKWC